MHGVSENLPTPSPHVPPPTTPLHKTAAPLPLNAAVTSALRDLLAEAERHRPAALPVLFFFSGDNILAVLRHLMMSDMLADSSEYRHGNMVFFDVLGVVVVAYPARVGTILNYVVATAAFLYLAKKASLPGNAGMPQLPLPRIYVLPFPVLGFVCVSRFPPFAVQRAVVVFSYIHTYACIPLVVSPTNHDLSFKMFHCCTECKILLNSPFVALLLCDKILEILSRLNTPLSKKSHGAVGENHLCKD